MAEIKISEMDELIPYDHYTLEGGTDTADYIPLLDSSEVDPNLQNKKVSIQTLFDDYTRQYNTIYPAVTKQTLTNNFFDLYDAQQYSFLNPGSLNRNIIANFLQVAEVKIVKNTGTTNTITVLNLLTNQGTSNYSYIIQPSKTIQIVFDGEDHHVIPLD